MNFSFWFDLVKAIREITQEVMNQKEIIMIEKLEENCRKILFEFSEINSNFFSASSLLSKNQLNEIKKKIRALNTEKVTLVYICVKVYVKLLKSFISFLETKTYASKEGEILFKIKLLLKLTRTVNGKIKEEFYEHNNTKKKKFFNLMISYNEKIQNKLYEISTELVKKLMLNGKLKTHLINNEKIAA